MKIEKSLVSGSMMLLILRLLEEKDMYGYEMIEALREKSQNVFELKAGTLYPLLHGLEEKNFVTSYEQKVCLLYTSPSPRDTERSRMPSSA